MHYRHINKIQSIKLEMQIKNPDISGLVTMTVPDTKTKEVDSKIPDLSSLDKKNYDAKRLEIKGKYFTNSDYNKFKSDIFDAKIRQKELVNNSEISDLVKKSD